jgi:glycosyltransferase involved in cell wall biosynthesis
MIGPILIYDPIPFVCKKDEVLVLMLHFGHLTTWILLLTKFIHRKKIILWGQGISVKRYLKEENKPSILLKWMIALSDGIWIYTNKEYQQWQNIFPNKPIVALNNTISGIERILNFKHQLSKTALKNKYKISQEICFIFCARFNNNYRRVDLLIDVIEKLDPDKFGFIIIGDGPVKPNFKKYRNVYDFGSVYKESIKDDLFSIADLYFQPGWLGLSVVEAFAYGKPVLTFTRSIDILQCVEYSYLIHDKNAFIFDNVDSLSLKVNRLTSEDINSLSANAKEFAQKNLLMSTMVKNAFDKNLLEFK